jgi:hypothetical protein
LRNRALPGWCGQRAAEGQKLEREHEKHYQMALDLALPGSCGQSWTRQPDRQARYPKMRGEAGKKILARSRIAGIN